MRVGIVILPEQRWAQAGHRWRDAETYGFDHAWTYDHLGWGPLLDGPWFDAITTLTAAAATTSTLRLGTFVSSPNFRHPVPFARQLLTLDDICGGRLTLGTGSGGAGHDRLVLGQAEVAQRERTERFAEFVDLLDKLLSNPRTDHKGDYYTAVDARSTPGCIQAPRIPFLVAANGPKAMRIAARHGQAWLTGPVSGEITGRVSTEVDGWWRQVADLVDQFNEILTSQGRPLNSVDRYITVDGSPLLSLSSFEAFCYHVERAQELGFTDLITHWPRKSGIYQADESVLETIASDVLPALHADARSVDRTAFPA